MRARILVVVVIATLGATACGSSSKAADAPSGTTTPAGSNTTTAPAVTTTTAASSDGGGGGGGGGDFCDLLRKESDAFAADDLLTSKTPDQIKDIYNDVVAKLDDTASKAPDEIKGDLSTLNDSIKKLVDAMKKVDYDFTKLTPDSFQGLDDPKFQTASDNIEKYLTDTCGAPAAP